MTGTIFIITATASSLALSLTISLSPSLSLYLYLSFEGEAKTCFLCLRTECLGPQFHSAGRNLSRLQVVPPSMDDVLPYDELRGWATQYTRREHLRRETVIDASMATWRSLAGPRPSSLCAVVTLSSQFPENRCIYALYYL